MNGDLNSEWLSDISPNSPATYEEWLELKLQSTRQALADTKAQLKALEDAIARLSDLDQKSEELEESIQATLRNAVANSRARKQNAT